MKKLIALIIVLVIMMIASCEKEEYCYECEVSVSRCYYVSETQMKCDYKYYKETRCESEPLESLEWADEIGDHYDHSLYCYTCKEKN